METHDEIERFRKSSIAGFLLFIGIALIMFGLLLAFAGSVTMPDFSGHQFTAFPGFFNLGVTMLAVGIVMEIVIVVMKVTGKIPPLPVTTSSSSPQSSIVTKETTIVKEIVMIPCQYCGGLMPQTSTFCPNCGAQRKA